MKTYKIFLASSNELNQDRKDFIIFISEYNKELKKHNIELQVEYWEDMDDKFNTSCKQDDYNAFLRQCTFFVMLFWSKVGKYTLEEFKLVQSLLQEGKDIYLYCYERTTPKEGATERDTQSKKDFVTYIIPENKEQFQSLYSDITQVTEKFRRNFQKLLDDQKNKVITSRANILLEQGQAAIPHNFMGRTQDLINIKKKLEDGGRLIVLKGEGGLGKSTLASAFMTENGHQYQNKAWIFCQKGIVDDLKSFVNDPEYFNDCINDVEKTITKLKHFLFNLPSSTLLVLDNLNDKNDLDTFKQHFGQLEWHVLATSRIGTSIREEYPVMHLPPDIAFNLFKSVYDEGSEAFNNKLQQLLIAIGYNTLLIEVFSKHLIALNNSFGDQLEDFLQKIEKEGLTLTKDAFKIETHYTSNIHKTYDSNRASVDQILEILYDFTDFQKAGFEHLRLYLVNLALLPAQSYDLKFLESLFGDRASGIIAGEQYFKPLADKGWLSYENAFYRMSPVVQDLVLAKNKENILVDFKILHSKLKIILESKLTNPELSTLKYVDLMHQINKSLYNNYNFELLKLNEFSYYIFENFYGYVNIYFLDKLIEISEFKVKKENSLHNRYLYYKCLIKRGDFHGRNMDTPNSLNIYNQIYSTLKEEYTLQDELTYLYATLLSKIGGEYLFLNEFDKAEDFFIQSHYLREQLYENRQTLEDKEGLSISFENLGDIIQEKGNIDSALDKYCKAIVINRELYESTKDLNYLFGVGVLCSKIGRVYLELENESESYTYFLEEVETYKKLCDFFQSNISYKNSLAIAYKDLASLDEVISENSKYDYTKASFNLSHEVYKERSEIPLFKENMIVISSKMALQNTIFNEPNEALLNICYSLDLAKEMFISDSKNYHFYDTLNLVYKTKLFILKYFKMEKEFNFCLVEMKEYSIFYGK